MVRVVVEWGYKEMGNELSTEGGGVLPSSGELMSPLPFRSMDVGTDKGMPAIDCSESHPSKSWSL